MKKAYPLSIFLRKRPLANGDESLFLDISRNGKRWKESLHLNLYKGSSRDIKLTNKTTLEKAERLLVKRQEELEGEINGEPQKADYKRAFFPYFDYCKERRQGTTKDAWGFARHHLAAYAKDEHLSFADITPAWCQGFADYLKTVNSRYKDKNGVFIKLSGTTQNNYFNHFVTCIHSAIKDRIISYDPTANVTRPKRTDKEREFLTREEFALLVAAPCKRENVKRLFLFGCLCGLRISDLIDLTWGDIRKVSNRDTIVKIMIKTGRLISVPLNNTALQLIGERQEQDAPVFPGLPQEGTILRDIKRWTKAAGIDKHITMHCSRHSFAVNLLDGGVDIYTTSKLLGHTDLKTTQIYAKVLDKNKTSAVDALDNLLKV